MILHPTDFSSCSQAAETQAVRLARALETDLLLVHVEAPQYGERRLSGTDVEQFCDVSA